MLQSSKESIDVRFLIPVKLNVVIYLRRYANKNIPQRVHGKFISKPSSITL
jgi:hypothetical protein